MPARTGKTRDRMMDVAEALFHHRGYSGVTVEDVTAALGVKKPDLYNHFRDKSDLYVAVRLRRLSLLSSDLAAALKDADAPFEQRLQSAVAALLRNPYFLAALVNRDSESFLPEKTRDLLFARSFGAVFEPVTSLLGEGIENGHLPAMEDTAFAFEALIAVTSHFGALDSVAADEERIARRAGQIAGLFLGRGNGEMG